MQALQTPDTHVEQFKGQQYPDVRVYKGPQPVQLEADVHAKHPLVQVLHVPKDKKYPLLHILQIPATHTKQWLGQQYPEVKVYIEVQLVQLVNEVHPKHPVEHALQVPNDK